MEYLLNTWYMAGWGSELEKGVLLARKLLDQPVVMFRDAANVAHALHDRCPHRFAPLSCGRLLAEKGAVRCGYHGLEFDGAGQCVLNPHGDGKIPAAAKVRSYPLVERYSVLWIWMGDPGQADPASIPDFSCMDPENWYVGKAYLRPRANYRLEVDNILDLSHIEFLHPDSLGSQSVRHAQTEVRQEGDYVWSMRFIENEVLPDSACDQFGVPRGLRVDRWLDVRWSAPSNLLLLGGGTPTGRPRSEAVGLNFTNPHLFTPETQSTSHYWFSMCQPKAGGTQAREIAERVVEQESIGDDEFWSLKPVLLVGDAAGVRVRRLLDNLIQSELTHRQLQATN
ncbi:aromatic ring-hydroxylating dioxygenase subunit alpha [Paraburkholderia hospita]|uniref:aromatic ring-hydroxylating dioxygenase subunit alpha n=1 Tax=Paraburkholderia hospita TaxID=169430 RepID=UPI000DEF50E0|nr:aromatic ring-hydroxylating dioxygenase subunit alpha [Paraburkholderia hospita]AXF05856.1 vanillate monooxygenase [Paraburkholderia hospita]